MALHPSDVDRLTYQHRRLTAALGETPPNRKEAGLIYRRVDDILDRRMRPVGLTPDNEVVWPDQSPFVQAQAFPLEAIAVNATGQAEVVLTQEQWRDMGGPDADTGGVLV